MSEVGKIRQRTRCSARSYGVFQGLAVDENFIDGCPGPSILLLPSKVDMPICVPLDLSPCAEPADSRSWASWAVKLAAPCLIAPHYYSFQPFALRGAAPSSSYRTCHRQHQTVATSTWTSRIHLSQMALRANKHEDCIKLK